MQEDFREIFLSFRLGSSVLHVLPWNRNYPVEVKVMICDVDGLCFNNKFVINNFKIGVYSLSKYDVHIDLIKTYSNKMVPHIPSHILKQHHIIHVTQKPIQTN